MEVGRRDKRGGMIVTGFDDKILICCECHEEFVFTSAAQEYFAERGYTEDPKRCKTCHTQYKKAQREDRRRFEVKRPELGLSD